jgi:hypothetical protein
MRGIGPRPWAARRSKLSVEEDEMVTIARFLEPVNAQMAKSVLESAGVECFLQGENANSMIAFAFRARLQVRREDEAAARALLAPGFDGDGEEDGDGQ